MPGVCKYSVACVADVVPAFIVDFVSHLGLCFSSWLACPPPCPLSLFPLLVSVMGECRGTSVGAHSWVLGSMPTMGVLPALGAYWLACFRWNP